MSATAQVFPQSYQSRPDSRDFRRVSHPYQNSQMSDGKQGYPPSLPAGTGMSYQVDNNVYDSPYITTTRAHNRSIPRIDEESRPSMRRSRFDQDPTLRSDNQPSNLARSRMPEDQYNHGAVPLHSRTARVSREPVVEPVQRPYRSQGGSYSAEDTERQRKDQQLKSEQGRMSGIKKSCVDSIWFLTPAGQKSEGDQSFEIAQHNLGSLGYHLDTLSNVNGPNGRAALAAQLETLQSIIGSLRMEKARLKRSFTNMSEDLSATRNSLAEERMERMAATLKADVLSDLLSKRSEDELTEASTSAAEGKTTWERGKLAKSWASKICAKNGKVDCKDCDTDSNGSDDTSLADD